MNTREITAEFRLSYWAGKMQERKNRGVSIREYCKTEGFCENVYYYWQRKLREMTCKELLTETKPNEKALPEGWAVVSAARNKSKEKTMTVEIGKVRISVDEDFNPEMLSELCKVLMPLC